MKLFTTIAAGVFMASAVSASAELCLLTVNEVIHMEGRCSFEADSDGSFSVRSPDGQVFAMLFVERPGVGVGHWNEYENRAHSPLGTMTRRGGCWSSTTATLCAWAN